MVEIKTKVDSFETKKSIIFTHGRIIKNHSRSIFKTRIWIWTESYIRTLPVFVIRPFENGTCCSYYECVKDALGHASDGLVTDALMPRMIS